MLTRLNDVVKIMKEKNPTLVSKICEYKPPNCEFEGDMTVACSKRGPSSVTSRTSRRSRKSGISRKGDL